MPPESSPLTSTQAVSLHHCACDVKLFEGCHAQRTPQVAGRPDESIGSCDGDFRFTGWQHHHYCLDVRNGDTSVLTETPGEQDKRLASNNAGTCRFVSMQLLLVLLY